MRMNGAWVAAAVVVAFSACDAGEADDCGASEARVARVVDGDTVELEGGEIVRYLLVDAPESTNGKHDCFGAEAARANRDLVEGRVVALAHDPAACRDRFGRTLAYVSVDGHDVNALLVERGYACVLYRPPAGESRHEEMLTLALRARAEGRGLWSACTVPSCE
jgi:micrococcal nuclease